MDKDSDVIKTEIIRILNENGNLRDTDLVRHVLRKVGNEKTVYKEISTLVQAGEIERRVHSKTYVEYRLVNLSEAISNQLKNLYQEIDMIYGEISNFLNISTKENFTFYERLQSVIHQIHVVQSTDGIMRLLSYYPAFKKDQMYSQITRKVTDCWEAIMDNIDHQIEEHFLNDVLVNLRVSRFDSRNVN